MGIVLYELLIGEPPFDGETMTAVCAAILQDQPASLTARRAEIAPELEAVVLQSLAKDPDRRFASVGAFAEGLRSFASASGLNSVARVMGTTRTWSPQLLPVATPRTITLRPAQVAPTATPPQAPGAATSTAWGDDGSKGRSKRSTAALLAGTGLVVAVMCVGSALGYAHFKKSGDPGATAAVAARGPLEAASADALLVARGAPALTAPSPDVPASATTVAVSAPSAEHVHAATTMSPRGVAPKAAIRPPSPTSPVTATTTATATATSSPAVLWNGRK